MLELLDSLGLERGLAEPMRGDCTDLTEVVVQSGHWMAEEKPLAVNAALVRWLATRLPALWRGSGLASAGDRVPRG
jgi:hypothetical protein